MRRSVALACGVVVLGGGFEARAACPAGVPWPEPEWAEALLPASAATKALDDYLFTLVGRDEERLGIRTDAVVVVHRGRIIHERYARGYAQHNRHLAWSVSKSVTSSLVGAAILRGDLTLEDSICDHYPAGDDEVCEMTVDDLLGWASGFDWNEGYENEAYYFSSVIAMLYGVGSRDMAAFVAGHPLRDAPGTYYSYSTGDTVLLSAVLAGAVGPDLADSFPWEFVFDPIGMRSAVFEREQGGAFVGGSYFYATPRDMARFGYLYLRDGCWGDARVLPEGWVAQSTEPHPAFFVGRPDDWNTDSIPGRHWWLNLPLPDLAHDSVWPSAPPDTFAALGHWGQSIMVVPSRDLVLVRTADDRDAGVFDKDRYLELALAVAGEDPP